MKIKKFIDPFQTNHLISSINQITGLYIKCNTGLKQVKKNTSKVIALQYLLRFKLTQF